MNLNKIKSMLAAASLLFAAGAVSTSCVGDLDVDPINPQQTMEPDFDAVFNKIYASFALTGQEGPHGNRDLTSFDEGQSDFFRMFWYMNEFTTDEAHWIWATDAGVPDVLHNTYGSTNDFSMGLYYRCYFTITLCNFYLDQIAEDGTEETAHRRAEVQFIRALNYFYLMDNYGNAAFIEHVSSEKAEFYTRSQFFTYLEKELKACEESLPAAGKNSYGRVDKVAAQNLLARMYLNAEVYTGSPQWQNAMDYAEKVINNGYYHLNTEGATNPSTGETYTAYQMLFLADNDTNGAQYENILPVLFDGIKTQSHGGMNFLVLSCYSTEMSEAVPSGTDNSWGKCTRVRGKLIDTFFGKGVDAPETDDVKVMTAAASDDRALFYSKGYTRYITDESEKEQGYSCVKFRNVRSDGRGASALVKVDTCRSCVLPRLTSPTQRLLSARMAPMPRLQNISMFSADVPMQHRSQPIRLRTLSRSGQRSSGSRVAVAWTSSASECTEVSRSTHGNSWVVVPTALSSQPTAMCTHCQTTISPTMRTSIRTRVINLQNDS